MKQNNSLIKSLSIYTGANILNAAAPFLLLPLLTRYLSPADFGIVAMFQVILSFILPFSGLNAEGAVSRQYFEKDKIDLPTYIGNAFILLFTGSVIVLLTLLLFGKNVESLTSFPFGWMGIIGLCAAGQNISEIGLALWQVQYRAFHYALFRIARTISDIGISVFLVVYLKKNWEGRIEGQFISTIVFSVLTLIILYNGKWIRLKINKAYMINCLEFGIPLIPHVVGAIIIAMSDRIFITRMVGLSEAGLYAAGYQIGMIIGLFQNSFNQAWVPWFYEKLKQKNEKTNLNIVKFTYAYFIVILAGAGLLSLIAPSLCTYFLGKDFSSAEIYVFWISLGFAFNGMYKMVVNYFFYIQKTYMVSVITFITAGLNIFLNYCFIKMNGAIGAAQATMISFFVQFLLVWSISTRAYHMPWLFFLHKK